MNTSTTMSTTLSITLEEGAVMADVKRALKMIKGVASVAIVKTNTPKAKVRTTFDSEELKSRIEKAEEDYREGRCICMQENETAEDFINRILCATT